MPLLRRLLGLALAAILAGLPAGSAWGRESTPVVSGVAAADSLAAWGAGAPREKALKRWAEHASLPELLYLLRRPSSQLGALEPMLAAAALKLAPESRVDLRRRLNARLLLTDPRRARLGHEALGRLAARPPSDPRASVFDVAALLPDSGDYESYGRSVLEGIRAGLLEPAAGLPIELRLVSNGASQPPRVAAAFDSAAGGAGAMIGELLSMPTLVLATAAHMTGVPLISPTATDESIGALGPHIFQIGPSGSERGAALARAALDGRPHRVGILISTANEPSAFARGFAATAESLNASVVWTQTYAAGAVSFGDVSRALTAQRVEILFWEGDGREVESLLSQLARDKVSIRICGGEALAPDQHHPETRLLLEGVLYVRDDWRLDPAVAQRLDSLVAVPAGDHASSLQVRGYLAGRLLRSAVARGALCPEELAAELAARTAREPRLRALGFLDVASEGAGLSIYRVQGGRSLTVR